MDLSKKLLGLSLNQFPSTGLMRMEDILQFIRVKQSTWYKWMRIGKIKQPIKIGHASLWEAEYILQVIDQIARGEF